MAESPKSTAWPVKRHRRPYSRRPDSGTVEAWECPYSMPGGWQGLMQVRASADGVLINQWELRTEEQLQQLMDIMAQAWQEHVRLASAKEAGNG